MFLGAPFDSSGNVGLLVVYQHDFGEDDVPRAGTDWRSGRFPRCRSSVLGEPKAAVVALEERPTRPSPTQGAVTAPSTNDGAPVTVPVGAPGILKYRLSRNRRALVDADREWAREWRPASWAWLSPGSTTALQRRSKPVAGSEGRPGFSDPRARLTRDSRGTR